MGLAEAIDVDAENIPVSHSLSLSPFPLLAPLEVPLIFAHAAPPSEYQITSKCCFYPKRHRKNIQLV